MSMTHHFPRVAVGVVSRCPLSSVASSSSSPLSSSSWIGRGEGGVKGSIAYFALVTGISLLTTTSITKSPPTPASCDGWWGKSKSTKEAEVVAAAAADEDLRRAKEAAADDNANKQSILSSWNLPTSIVPNSINELTIDNIATSMGTQLSNALASNIPANISYGFVAGYASGYALKKIGRIAALVLGTAFLGMQTLAASGYVTVDHDKIQRRVEGLMDRNKDGMVNVSDLKDVVDSARKVAGFGILEDEEGESLGKLGASAAGFGTGFYGGLRSG